MNSRVKIDFQRLKVPEKIQRASSIVTAMDGNINFPSPTPTLEQVRTMIEKLEDAYQDAQFGGRNRKSLMYIYESELVTGIVGLGGYVQAASQGDDAIILSSGFELKSFAASSRPVAVPSVPGVVPGRLEGEVLLRWTPVSGAKSYLIRLSHDSGETWEDAGHFTRTKIVIAGLPPGTRPWFKVAAFGTLGQSNWSEPGFGKVA